MSLALKIILGVLFWWLLPIIICIVLANRKGFPPDTAGRMGCLLGWFGVLLYLFKSDR
jgi:hypothetical protein